MLAVCARNRSLIGTPFSANWDTWGFDDPHKTQPQSLKTLRREPFSQTRDGLAAEHAPTGSSRHRQKIAAIPASASILPRSWHWARAAPPTVAARMRIVSAAGIRLDHRKSVRPFKGIFCHDVCEFESYMPSHAVVSKLEGTAD